MGRQRIRPQRGFGLLDGALGGISQEEDAVGRRDCGLAAAAWRMEVGSSLQLVVVGMGRPMCPFANGFEQCGVMWEPARCLQPSSASPH